MEYARMNRAENRADVRGSKEDPRRERERESTARVLGGHAYRGEANFVSALCGTLLKMRGESTAFDRRLTGQLQDPSSPVGS